MKTVVIDGVECEERTGRERYNLDTRILYYCPLPKPKKTILDRANELFDGCELDRTYSAGAVAEATEERIAGLEKRLEALEK